MLMMSMKWEAGNYFMGKLNQKVTSLQNKKEEETCLQIHGLHRKLLLNVSFDQCTTNESREREEENKIL